MSQHPDERASLPVDHRRQAECTIDFLTLNTIHNERYISNHERAGVTTVGASTDTYTPTHVLHEHASRPTQRAILAHPRVVVHSGQAWPHEKPHGFGIVIERSLGLTIPELS